MADTVLGIGPTQPPIVTDAFPLAASTPLATVVLLPPGGTNAGVNNATGQISPRY